MRAVIYTRVSKDKRERASVQQQEAESRQVIEREGWTLDRVFEDANRSASEYARRTREEYTRLREYLATASVGVLILWESSRGSRELEDWAGFLNLCARRSIRIHVVSHGRTYDLGNSRDWRTLAEDGVDSAYESKKTSARIKRDVRRNATEGRPHGKLPFGYGRQYDERGQFVRQYEKPEEGAVIREAARRIVEGESLYSIAQDLNAREVPAPRGGKWLATQVKRLAVNPRYIGQRVHQGAVIGPAVWPAILDEATHLECRRILEDPRRVTVRDLSLKYLLSGLAKCGECGAKMRVIKNRGYYAYACYEKFCTAVKVERLDEYVELIVKGWLSRPDVLEWIASRSAEPEDTSAEDEVRALEERLEAFEESAAAGEISPAGFASIEARIRAQIDEAKGRQVSARVPAVLRQVAGPDIERRWPELPVGMRREIVDRLMTVKVNRTVRGSRFSPERVDIEWKTV